MDTHKISMLLEHDVPVGRHLHIPSPNSKYHEVACRQAHLTVVEMLTRHASFTMVEANSYVKILDKCVRFSKRFFTVDPQTLVYCAFSGNGRKTFCVIRLVSKSACVVLRVAFLRGCSDDVRAAVSERENDFQSLITVGEH